MIPQHLLLRLLSIPSWYKGEVNLTVDRLPDGLPVELPIIEQAEVVASFSYSQNSFYIFLDIPNSPQQIQTTYRNILRGKGWQQLSRNEPDNPVRVGLGFSYPIGIDYTASVTFCYKKSNASLVLTTPPLKNSITKATLKLELDPYSSPCQAEWERKASFNNIPMPILIEPPQTEITKMIGSGGGEANYNTTAIITTQLERKTLLDSYYSQMEEMGWKKIEAAEEDLLYISLWEFQDSDNSKWRGMFNWTKLAKDSDKYLGDFEIIKQSIIDNSFTSAIQSIPLNNKQISRELAQRILDNVWQNEQQKGQHRDYRCFLAGSGSRGQLLVGQLPSQLPVELPLPNNAEIVGSFNREDSWSIFLEVPQSPARIEQFYHQQLTAASWEKHQVCFDIFKTKGFISSGYKPVERELFCNQEQGWELSFNTHPSQANYTDLRLQIKKITPNSWCSFPLDRESQNHTEILFKQISAPILNPPEKAEVLFLNPVGGSGMQSSGDPDGNVSLNKYDSGAMIQTELSIKEIANHWGSVVV